MKARKTMTSALPRAVPQATARAFAARQRAAVMLALALVVLIAYWPALGNGFITLFDDNVYVTENTQVRAGLSLRGTAWAFTTFHAANWHPLTWLSHMLDVELLGLNPGRHHAASLLMHAANTTLLFRVLALAGGSLWPSAFVAAVFGIHPLHVESVAWIAERKDVLSTLFLVLALLAYLHYQRRRTRFGFALVLLAYAAGLMSKPMLVSFPFLLLLLDFWPLGRSGGGRRTKGAGATRQALAVWAPLIREKLPLFALAAASGAMTFLAQSRGGSVSSLDQIPLALRGGNALQAYAAYLFKAVWPSGLAVYYPHPLDTLPAWRVLLAAIFLAGVTVMVIPAGKTRPHLPVGWFWYLVTLAPVIGLVQVGSQSMADRYMYVPLVGLCVMASWSAAIVPGRRKLLVAACVLVLPPLLMLTRRQVGFWKDSDTVFRHAARVTTGNWLAHYNLGVSAAQQGRPGEAARHYQEALLLEPGHTQARANLTWLLARVRR